MEKEILDKLLTLLRVGNIEFVINDKLYILSLKNNIIKVKAVDSVINLNKIEQKTVLEEEYSIDDFINLDFDISKIIEEKYNEYLRLKDQITKEYELITHYLLICDLKEEDKDILEEILNIAYKNEFVNLNENYGISFINIFTKEIKLTLINLKSGMCYTNYQDIFSIILKEFHKNRVKFRNSLEYYLKLNEKYNQRK